MRIGFKITGEIDDLAHMQQEEIQSEIRALLEADGVRDIAVSEIAKWHLREYSHYKEMEME